VDQDKKKRYVCLAGAVRGDKEELVTKQTKENQKANWAINHMSKNTKKVSRGHMGQ